MTQVSEVLNELKRRGISVMVEGDTLRLKPRRALDDALLARIQETKPAILETLRSRPMLEANSEVCGSAHCIGCYDVGDGRKIHPPKCGEKYRKWLERWQPKGRPQ